VRAYLLPRMWQPAPLTRTPTQARLSSQTQLGPRLALFRIAASARAQIDERDVDG